MAALEQQVADALNPNPTTRVEIRPGSQGANIRTWIGFKHLLYVVEEGILDWFRQHGLGPQRLLDEFGLMLEIIDCSALLVALITVDDTIVVTTTLAENNEFHVRCLVTHGTSDAVSLKARAQVALTPTAPPPGKAYPDSVAPWLSRFSTSEHARTKLRPRTETPSGPRSFRWDWQARYFDCHYSHLVRHSAYARVLEELVDRFLTDRGLSISRMLHEYKWIPVVSRVRISLLADARLDDVIDTRFVIDDVVKGLIFDGHMECLVNRNGQPTVTATARILHGYAISEGERAGQLTEMDEATVAALRGCSDRDFLPRVKQ